MEKSVHFATTVAALVLASIVVYLSTRMQNCTNSTQLC